MVVYVEYVFLDNFIIDYMLISLARKSLKLNSQKRWLILSACLGGCIAIVNPLLKLSLPISFLLKMPIGFFIVLASGKFRNFKECIKCFYLFLFFTFSFGGCVTAVFWGLGLSFDPIKYSYGGEVPLFIILITVFACYKLCYSVVISIYKRKRVVDFAFKCCVTIGGKSFLVQGVLDSGNSLVYKKTESPIVVCSNRFAQEMELQGVLSKAYFDSVKINTVSGEDVMPLYKVDKFLIYISNQANILNNVMIGVAKGVIFPNGEYDLLLGPIVLEVVKC